MREREDRKSACARCAASLLADSACRYLRFEGLPKVGVRLQIGCRPIDLGSVVRDDSCVTPAVLAAPWRVRGLDVTPGCIVQIGLRVRRVEEHVLTSA